MAGQEPSGTTYSAKCLTINVCTVDRRDHLLACLESLSATTPEGVSLIVLFNGTPTSIVEAALPLIEAWNGPARHVVLPKTIPLTESHNLALSMVTTPLVNFMGDDDLVLAPRIAPILDAFNSLDPQPLVVSTFARRIAGDARRPRVGSNKDLGPTSIDEWRRWRDNGRMFEMLWPGAVLATEALRSIGGLDPNFDRTFDNRIFTKLSALGPVLSLRNRDFGYRIHEGSLSSSSFLLQSQQVRHVQACRTAELEGRTEPSPEAFAQSERNAPLLTRLRVDLRARSRMHFRRGSAQLLEGGNIASSARHIILSAILWPPAFIEKLRDQGQPWQAFERVSSPKGAAEWQDPAQLPCLPHRSG